MNAAVSGPATRESAYATVGAGRRIRPEDLTLNAQRSTLNALLRERGLRTGYVGDPGGGPGLVVAGPDVTVTAEAAPDVPARLFVAASLLKTTDFLVIDSSAAPHGPTLNALILAQGLTRRLDPNRDILILTSPDPGQPRSGEWTRLAPVLFWGEGWTPAQGPPLTTHHSPLTASSPTTRTPGLVANVDVAPTLLAHFGIEAPASMEGRPIRPAPGLLRDVRRLAAHARVNREAMVPGLLFWGGIALIAAGWALFVLLRPTPRRAASARLLLTFAAAFPPAMLLAALIPAPTPIALVGSITAVAAAVTALCATASRLRLHPTTSPPDTERPTPGAQGPPLTTHHSPLTYLLALGTAVVLADLYTGGRLLATNLMSDFANVGARFYGIGNEYEGLILATTLLLPPWIESLRGRTTQSGGAWIATAALWGVTLVGVGAPWLGADFGGAVAFAAAYCVSGVLLFSLASGRKPRARHFVLGIGAALLVAAGLVALDLFRPAEERSHVGNLAAKVLSEGWGGIWEVASRKALLNVRMALSPYFIGGILAALPVVWLGYHRLGADAREVLDRRPLAKVGLVSTVIGGLTVLVLNDTGVVAWALATACALFVLFDVMLAAVIHEP
jgi:hypothetical protein